jgi:dolichol kinase
MADIQALQTSRRGAALLGREIRTEIVRKSIHIVIGIVPTLASLNRGATLALLAGGIVFYAYCELLRLDGYEIPVISRVTAAAARRRDAGRFVLGPVTLGLGAMLALILYPEPAASLAIYALAFGDGISSLAGRLFGSIRIPFTGGKSLEGSVACFGAVLLASWSATRRPLMSLAVAAFATLVEAVPSKDLDNLLLPVAVGAFVHFLF